MKPCYLPVQCPCPWSNMVSRINQNSNFLPCRCRQQKRTKEEHPEASTSRDKTWAFQIQYTQSCNSLFQGPWYLLALQQGSGHEVFQELCMDTLPRLARVEEEGQTSWSNWCLSRGLKVKHQLPDEECKVGGRGSAGMREQYIFWVVLNYSCFLYFETDRVLGSDPWVTILKAESHGGWNQAP